MNDRIIKAEAKFVLLRNDIPGPMKRLIMNFTESPLPRWNLVTIVHAAACNVANPYVRPVIRLQLVTIMRENNGKVVFRRSLPGVFLFSFSLQKLSGEIRFGYYRGNYRVSFRNARRKEGACSRVFFFIEFSLPTRRACVICITVKKNFTSFRTS